MEVWTEDPNNPGKDKKTGLTRYEYSLEYGPVAAGLTDPTGFTDGRTVVISPAGTRVAVVGRPGSPQRINQTIPATPLLVGDAKALFNGGLLSQDPSTLAIADFMFSSGIISADPRTASGRAAATKAYNKAVDDTADANQYGNMATVMDMLTLNYSPGSTTGSGTSTFKQFSTYTKDQAKKKAIDAYRAVLGRSPSAQEIAEFSNGLIKAAKAAPSIQKTKTGKKGTEQETTQGFNEKDWTLGFLSAKIPLDADLQGASGVAQDMVTGFSEQYGVKLSPTLAYDSVRDIIEGKLDANGLEQVFKEQAKILFPHLSDKIDSGINPRKIADSYIANTVNILEKAPTEVDMFSPEVKQALTYKDKDGNYALPTADEHARTLRSKSEWLDTRNGKETLMRAADNILRQMGFE